MDATKFPWKWSTMTDSEIRRWLLCVAAGRDASREHINLAAAEWPRDEYGKPDLSRLPPRIYMATKHHASGPTGCAVWWDFDATVCEIRRYFPYTPCAAPMPTLESM